MIRSGFPRLRGCLGCIGLESLKLLGVVRIALRRTAAREPRVPHQWQPPHPARRTTPNSHPPSVAARRGPCPCRTGRILRHNRLMREHLAAANTQRRPSRHTWQCQGQWRPTYQVARRHDPADRSATSSTQVAQRCRCRRWWSWRRDNHHWLPATHIADGDICFIMTEDAVIPAFDR